MKMCVKIKFVIVLCSMANVPVLAGKCGCKTFSSCFTKMLETLQEQDEVQCVEDSSIGTSTVTIFLHALQAFCQDVITVNIESETFDGRNLYEVIIEDNRKPEDEDDMKPQGPRPTVIIDGGQEGGMEPVKFSLFIIEQLIACQENKDMIQNVKWVIMPSTNPDGLEFSRYKHNYWRKNLKVDEDEVSFGVDISRNFDEHWGSCPKVKIGFSDEYPGPSAASEKETIFIKNIITKHKNDAKIYVSLRRDGHHFAYPHAYTDTAPPNKDQLALIAGEVAYKVNFRSGGVHIFKNGSLNKIEGKERCGHSVDWAYANGIKWSFEMRVYLERDNKITARFQALPRGYNNMLRNGYFTGIRELYSVLTNKKKYAKLSDLNKP